jgi:hypothetical protein
MGRGDARGGKVGKRMADGGGWGKREEARGKFEFRIQNVECRREAE